MIPYSDKYSARRYIQPQLFAILTFRQFFKNDYHSIEQMLHNLTDLRRAPGLKRVPNHSTPQKAESRLEKNTSEARATGNSIVSTSQSNTDPLFASGVSIWPRLLGFIKTLLYYQRYRTRIYMVSVAASRMRIHKNKPSMLSLRSEGQGLTVLS